MQESILIPKALFEKIKTELEVLRKSKLYKRLLEFEKNISEGKKYTRKDVGF